MQWQRAHIDAADIKSENHDMAIVFGNEMADATAMQAANEAALRGAAAEQVAWWTRWLGKSNGESLRQTCKASKTNPTVEILRENLGRVQYKTVLQALFEQTTHQLAISAIKTAVGMSNL